MPPDSPPVQAPKTDLFALSKAAPLAKAREHPFTAVYQQNVERIYRYHLARTGSVQDAQDLTAETFHAALEGFEAFDPALGCAAAWLTGIAQHKLADHYRRSRQTDPMAQMDDQPDPAASTEEAGARRLQMGQVTAALRRLPDSRAEALSLHFFAGLTLSEAAQVMRRSEEAVKKLIHRGLADLRRLLDYPSPAEDSVEVKE